MESRTIYMEQLPITLTDSRNEKNSRVSKFQESATEWREDSISLFDEYKPHFSSGYPHPSKMTESCSLSGVGIYRNSVHESEDMYLPHHNEHISDVQYDAVVLATNSFRKIIHTSTSGVSTKQGFYLGDGTGSGKGRTIVAIISEQIRQGHTRHVWVTVSKDLIEDSQRDINDIGLSDVCKLVSIYSHTKEELENCNILFVTYSSLVSDKSYSQIQEWIGNDFDGVIAFDECHKGKNLNTTKTKTAKRMIELQEKSPHANILYVSATGCSDIKHMCYLDRLGLWGYKESNFSDFKEFADCMKRGGVCSSEMVSMYLKETGKFISRHLSFDNISFSTSVVNISTEPEHQVYTKIYSECVNAFSNIKETLFPLFQGKHKMHYWGTQLRFYKALITTFKVNKTIQIIDEALSRNESIIINIQNTAESYIDKAGSNTDTVLSSPKHIMVNYLETLERDSIDTKHIILPKSLDSLENPLDAIINHYGVDNVSELTGRKFRFQSNKKIKRKLNNIQEKDLFMSNKKKIAILSDATSTGISLHSIDGIQRLHIIMELPWSAEQFVQQCGRSHRTGELIKPKYELIITDIGGEKRFVSTIIRRLKMLGALTCGNRESRMTLDNSMDYDTPDGARVAKNIIKNMDTNEHELFNTSDNNNILKIFMNKLLTLEIKRQNEILMDFDKHMLQFVSNTQDAIGDIVCKDSILLSTDNVNRSTSIHEIQLNTSISKKDVLNYIKNNPESYSVIINKFTKQIYLANYSVTTGDYYNIHSPIKYNYAKIHKDCYINNYDKIYVNEDNIDKLWINSKGNTKNINMITGNVFGVWVIIQKHLSRMNLPMYIKRIKKHNLIGFIVPSHNIPQIRNAIKNNINS